MAKAALGAAVTHTLNLRFKGLGSVLLDSNVFRCFSNLTHKRTHGQRGQRERERGRGKKETKEEGQQPCSHEFK